MNTDKRINQWLRAAPRPSAPEVLLGKLRRDITLGQRRARPSVLRKWLAPRGDSISPWRVAAAAAIGVVVLLPLSYGATRVIKRFTLFEATFDYPRESGEATGNGTEATKAGSGRKVGVNVGIGFSSDDVVTEEDARRVQQEFYELYKQGKATEVKPGVWKVTLPDGRAVFIGAGGGLDPEFLGLSDAERHTLLEKQIAEMSQLRKDGQFERTFIEEFERDGIVLRRYRDRFTLSDGRVITTDALEGTGSSKK